jgi:hypothetical protein
MQNISINKIYKNAKFNPLKKLKKTVQKSYMTKTLINKNKNGEMLNSLKFYFLLLLVKNFSPFTKVSLTASFHLDVKCDG